MRFYFSFTLTIVLAMAGLACSNDPGTTRQQAAKTTEQLKQESREAAGNVKKGAAVAQTQITAAAQGVKEGLNDKNSSLVDLNSANKARLMGLPGIDEARANAIIADRPYQQPRDVVRKGAITANEYAKISDHVTVGSK
ncbi:MAG TPA: helix-hairpin-helix domain-containing protein [Candidatus Angelobacter sp.]|nr:helix-hairpin-helix domain-containing protein [Candidatus Angelobacter sp.]